MGVDLGLVRLPCTCTMSYYYATHRMEFSVFSLFKSIGIYAVLVDFGWFSTPNADAASNDGKILRMITARGSSCFGSVEDSQA